MWWDIWPLLYLYKFTAEPVLKQFLKYLNIWQNYGGKLIASSSLCAEQWLTCWKMKNSLEMWRMAGRNCCNSITLRLIIVTNLDSVIDKCQTGIMSTTCFSPTDVISDWKLTVWALQAFCHDAFFMVDGRVKWVILRVFRCRRCKYLFVGE